MADTSLPKPSSPQTPGGVSAPAPAGAAGSAMAASAPTPPTPPTPPPKPASPSVPPLQPAPGSRLPVMPVAASGVQLPPKSLSALSSMSGNKIPTQVPAGISEAPGFPAQTPSTLASAQPAAVPVSAPAPAAVPAPAATPASNIASQAPTTSLSPTAGQPQNTQTSQNPLPNAATPAKAASYGENAQKPKVVKPKKSILRFLPLVVGALVVIGIIAFLAMRFLGGNSPQSVTPAPGDGTGGRQVVPSEQVTIQYWGLWEPSGVMEEVLADFEAQNPGVTVEYTQQSHRDYRERLQTAISSGSGPDVYRFHASWTPMLSEELSPLPDSVIGSADFRNNYYPVASQQLVIGGQIAGIPMMYDGLALLYNTEIFETANLQPPTTWSELRTTASRLTIRSGSSIERAGAALGNATNVEHFSDILALLMLQNGADPAAPNSAETRDALLFYTNFVSADKVWDDTLPPSTVAFARGDVAMIFAPSWRIHEILATNPEAPIGVAPVPKLADERLSWASYWAEGISSKSKNKDAAGVLLKYMSSPEVLRKFYSTASEVRSFGELYPRVDMAEELAGDQYVSAYLEDAPYAQGWYLSSATFDNGINDLLIQYYEDAVTGMLGGESAEDVLTTIDQGTGQVLRQYGAE